MAGLLILQTTCAFSALILLHGAECSPKLQRRLAVFESRLNTLEMRLAMDTTQRSDEITQVFGQLLELNNTLMEIVEDIGGQGVDSVANRPAPVVDKPQATEMSVGMSIADREMIAAVKDEKRYIRQSLERVNETLDGFRRDIETKIDARFKTILEGITNEKLKSSIEELRASTSEHLKETQDEMAEELGEIRVETSENLAKYRQQILKFEKEQTMKDTEINTMKKVFEKKIDDIKDTIDSRFQRLFECPDHWTRYDLFCYHFFNTPVQFNKARELCADVGGHVVDVQDQRELEFVMGMVRGSNFWIGLTDSDKEGTWRWDRTNAITSFTNWRAGQPDNRHGSNQDCAIAGWTSPKDQWNDQGCHFKHAFVCKKSL